MRTIADLCIRAFDVIKEDGVIACAKRTSAYISINKDKIRTKRQEKLGKVCRDVLFINGCYLAHPARYRVLHQMEQLSAAGITNEQVFYNDITMDLVKKFRVFIFFRCSYTDEIAKFISMAKKLNKTVLYDIDDLIIDRKYTDKISYLRTMNQEERKEYDYGIDNMGKLLKLCNGAITTTKRLAEELGNYVPEVYINRNTASEEMVKYSEEAIFYRDTLPYLKKEQLTENVTMKQYAEAKKVYKERRKLVRLGYFSGSFFHNDDVKIIVPVLEKIMEKYSNVELHLVGKINLPEELKKYKMRIIAHPFVDWKELPKLIASVDINLAPIEQTIFNEAKSENKWIEAALVKVPTVASNVGAFQEMIKDGETGFLCDREEEWYDILCELIEKKGLRKKIAEQAYLYVHKYCISIYNANGLREFIIKVRKPNIIFILPSIQIGGGMLVILKHAAILQKKGYDITIYNEQLEEEFIKNDECIVPVVSVLQTKFEMNIDKIVASLWSTCSTAQKMQCNNIIGNIYYLVQGYETNFYEYGNELRIKANSTYYMDSVVTYLTVSRWCEKWLRNNYNQEVRFAPNGLEREKFYPVERKFNGRIRILVEGNCDDYYKNVDESFRIVDKLNKDRYEIWYMSYLGKPKQWYCVDKFLHKVPYEKVPDVYRKCHILIKSSVLESFSYPPLEMMATGGFVVAVSNEGNVEYMTDRENAMFYSRGDIDAAVKAIEEICSDEQLRNKLYAGGLKTADERKWEKIEQQVMELYK